MIRVPVTLNDEARVNNFFFSCIVKLTRISDSTTKSKPPRSRD